MKRIFIIAALLTFGVVAAFAQEKLDANKMIQNRVSYMKGALKLSAAESKAFWPAYEQFLRNEIKLHETYRKNIEKKGIKANCPNCPNCDENKSCEELTDEQITYLFDQKFELRKSLLTLETTFYKKIKTILTAKNLQEFYKKDEKFKRNLATSNKKAAPAATKEPQGTPHKAKR